MTGLSIAIGVAGLLFTFGYILRIEAYLRIAQIYTLRTGHLSIYKEEGLDKHMVKPELYSLTAEEQSKLSALLAGEPDVERHAFFLEGAGLLSNGCKVVPYRAVGVDLETERWLRTHPLVRTIAPELGGSLKGRGLWEYGEVEGAVALSRGLSIRANKPRVHDEGGATDEGPVVLDCEAPDVQDRIARDTNVQLVTGAFSGSFSAMDGEVVNLFTTGFTEFEDTTVVAALPTLRRLYETDLATRAAVFLRDPGEVGTRAQALEARLRAEGLNVKVYPWNDARIAPTYVGLVQFLKVLGTCIFLVLAMVVALSVINAITVSVIERSRELGTLRALGFTPRHILRLLLVEVLVLALIASSLGLVAGGAAAMALNASDIRFKPPGVAGTLPLIVRMDTALCLSIALSIGLMALIATAAAARKHVRRRILELLQAA